MAQRRVLVVDNDREAARRHCRYLAGQAGFTVVGVALTAPQAAVMVGNLRPHLVLLDVSLPGGDGIPLLRRLRGAGYPLEVIVTTEVADVETVRSAVQLGVVDYLVKPFYAERLRQALGLFLRRSAAATAGARLDQQDIDELTAASGPTHRWLPRDLQADRLQQIREALANATRPLTAEQVAGLTGVARTTARRYLEYLVTTEEAAVENTPTGPGRPTKSYERRGSAIGTPPAHRCRPGHGHPRSAANCA